MDDTQQETTAIVEKQKKGSITIFDRADVLEKFEKVLGSRTTQFITSVLSVISQNATLKDAEPTSVYMAALTAATLDLPINPNLGFAYIIPYYAGGKQVAQFQMWYKGFIQLAQRSGQFRTISASPVREGQIVSEDPLTGYVFDWTKKDSKEIVGYASFFRLTNGFEKTMYMSKEELEAHGKEFSKNYGKDSSLWKKDFDSMATKTVIKLLLSKYAPLSISMQNAIVYDQWVIRPDGVDYVDNSVSMDEALEGFERADLSPDNIIDG